MFNYQMFINIIYDYSVFILQIKLLQCIVSFIDYKVLRRLTIFATFIWFGNKQQNFYIVCISSNKIVK